MEKPTIELVKKELREKMLLLRAKFPKKEKKVRDEWICDQIENLIRTNDYRIIHAYLPMGKEIDITPLLEKLLKYDIKVVTPKTLRKRQLENRILQDLAEIETGVFGTTHPKKPDIYKGPFDLIIVPGLAYDSKKYRLGYGGGYYDNFLSQHPEAFKLGIFYSYQEVQTVPTEPHDIKLDDLIST